MLRMLSLAALVILLLAACTGPAAPAPQTTGPDGEPVVTVFKSPT